MPTRFDLITVDVEKPRETAASILADRPEMSIELDEDDGRWLVIASGIDSRRFGLQRSDRREVAARLGQVDDVLSGCMALSVTDVATAARFFSEAAGLSIVGSRLEHRDVPVIELVAATPQPSNLHLDLACDPAEFDAEADRMLDLGASRIGPRRSESWGTSQIFAAPVGGVFCLNAYAE